MYVSHRWNNFCLRKAGGSRLIQSVEEQERNAEYWHFGNFLWTKWQWESEVKHCVVTTHTRLCLKFKCGKWKWSFAKKSSSGESHSLFFPHVLHFVELIMYFVCQMYLSVAQWRSSIFFLSIQRAGDTKTWFWAWLQGS